jgi:hypothetical protein
MLFISETAQIRDFPEMLHLDLAGQAPADIQMLYYYITLSQEMQGVSANFF